VEVGLRPEGTEVVLTVSDGGPGIEPQDRENVFRPFFRGADRQNVRGYGLGLALVRQIAEAHGGSAAVVAEGRLRSSVAVRLPISSSAPRANGA
jgi:signal transduction histidine kinase